MIEAQADVALGEAIRPAAAAHARIHKGGLGAIFLPALILAAGIIIGTTAGAALESQFPLGGGGTAVLGLIGLFIGSSAALSLYSRRQLAGFLAGLRRMGSPDLFPTRFRFSEEAIFIDSERLSHRLAWSAVGFVLPSRDHWLIQADSFTIAVPRRAFADPAAEQAFLDLVSKQLTPDARARSVLARQ